jgi:hypothetical protein
MHLIDTVLLLRCSGLSQMQQLSYSRYWQYKVTCMHAYMCTVASVSTDAAVGACRQLYESCSMTRTLVTVAVCLVYLYACYCYC